MGARNFATTLPNHGKKFAQTGHAVDRPRVAKEKAPANRG
jgi:hypothetical protein